MTRIVGLEETVRNYRYKNGISVSNQLEYHGIYIISVPKALQSWMTAMIYFPRRFYVIRDSTDEYLAELRTRGNDKWIFYSDLTGVESHLF